MTPRPCALCREAAARPKRLHQFANGAERCGLSANPAIRVGGSGEDGTGEGVGELSFFGELSLLFISRLI